MFDFCDSSKPKIHFISHLFPDNAADLCFSPLQYFRGFLDEWQCVRHRFDSINYNIISPLDWVILGGGDLYDCYGNNAAINRLILWTGGRVITWGCGSLHMRTPDSERLHTDKTALFSSREFYVSDVYSDAQYVPCVSCMQPQLSENNASYIKRGIGIIEHREHPISGFENIDKINHSIAPEQILHFIRTSGTVITNSYHVLYWSVLMRRKVILYERYADKYSGFRYPVTDYSGDIASDIELAGLYPDALSECVETNRKYCADVMQTIRSDDRRPHGLLKIFLRIFNGIKDKKCAVKGAGISTGWLLTLMRNYFEPVCIYDGNRSGGPALFDGYEAVGTSEFPERDIDVVVIASLKYRNEMKQELLRLGRQYDIFDIYEELSKIGIGIEDEFFSIKTNSRFLEAFE
jgi:hypothetical protein